MEDGEIKQQGKFEELMQDPNSPFAELMREYGGTDDHRKKHTGEGSSSEESSSDESETEQGENKPTKTSGQALMTAEERAVGAVAGAVYKAYIKAGGGWFIAILLSVTMLLYQLTRIGNDLWLSWWSDDELDLDVGEYMGGYAGWGLGQMLVVVLFNIFLAYLCARASRTLHDDSIENVFRAPLSFFDTTPLGRIMNR
jgi:ATP-binding cassette subfamily C (CFTR/MRP) protein 1